jgi:hypothetical protein
MNSGEASGFLGFKPAEQAESLYAMRAWDGYYCSTQRGE